jgi:8-oxo-dGTP diphosphatase
MVEFGESLENAVLREFTEETGFQAKVTGVLDVSEVILPERPYHSVTIAYSGKIIGGELRSEKDHPYGEKKPRWFDADEVTNRNCHPQTIVRRAMGPY